MMRNFDPITLPILDRDAGTRMDAYLASRIPVLTRSLAAKYIRSGDITLEGNIKKPGYRLKSGDVITGFIPPPEPIGEFQPEPIELDILYDDEFLAVINKRPGIVVHPAPGHPSGTIVNALLHHFPDIHGTGGKIRPGIVHRLDKDTTGALIVAKDDRTQNYLSREFKYRRVSKKYLALVYGQIQGGCGTISFPIGRHPTDRKKMSVRSARARDAETAWTLKARYNGASLVDIRLKTGRTHQIRVHFSAIHHPVLGDPLYGPKRADMGLSNAASDIVRSAGRQMLHAFEVTFIHPISGEKVLVQAPVPDDMKRLIQILGDEMNA